MLSKEFCFLSQTCVDMLLQWISQDLCVIIQALLIPHFQSFSFIPSLLPVVIKLSSVLINSFTQKEKWPVLAITMHFYARRMRKFVRNLRMLAIVMPSKFTVLLPNVYAQHTSITTQLFWILASQPKQFKMHLHLSCRTHTLINKYVIDLWGSSTIDGFILPDHSFYDRLHDLWSYV